MENGLSGSKCIQEGFIIILYLLLYCHVMKLQWRSPHIKPPKHIFGEKIMVGHMTGAVYYYAVC